MTFGFGLGLPHGITSGGPALNYNFTQGVLPQGVTFSRGTVATQYNSQGLVAYAPSNLLLQSNSFSTSPWVASGGVAAVTTNVVAPDGTLAYIFTSSSSNAYLYQPITASNNTTYTLSVWVMSTGTPITANLALSQNSGATNALATPFTTSNIWQRVVLTGTLGTPTAPLWFLIGGGGQIPLGSSLYIWGAQLEQSPTATTYTPTTTAAVYGPRFDYDPGNVLQQNWLSYSQQFNNAAWSNSHTTVYPNTLQAPDGTYTASTITNTVGQNSYISQGTPVSVPVGTAYVMSVYLQQLVGNGLVYFENIGAVGISPVTVNLLAGTISTGTLTPVGNGWYLASWPTTTNASSPNPHFVMYMNVYGVSTSAQSVGVWGAQVSVSSAQLPYLATTSTPQTVCAPKGLLIEEARTNTVLWSTAVGGTNGWVQTGATTAVNSSTAPDGTTTASLISEDTSVSAQHAVYGATTVSASTAIALTCYIKASGRSYAYIQYNDTTSANDAWTSFNLTTGAVVTAPTTLGGTFTNMASSAVNVGNGWFRVIFTLTTSTVANGSFYIGSSPDGVQRLFTGSGAAAIYVWGAQCEVGAFPTSYIPTTAATVTRNADVAQITSFPWFNATAGSFVAVFDAASITQTTSIIGSALSSGAAIMYSSIGDIKTFDGTTGAATTGSYAINTTAKGGLTYSASGRTVMLNGNLGGIGTVAGNLQTVTSIVLGSGFGANYLNGHIQSIQYFNYALTNTQLQALTYAQYILLENGNRILLENNSGDILLG